MNQKSIILHRITIACIVASIAVSAYAGPPAGVLQNPTEISGQAFSRQQALQHRSEIHQWLMSEALSTGTRNPLNVHLTTAEKNDIDNAPRGMVPERVGLAKSMNVSVSFDDLTRGRVNGKALSRPFGAIGPTADGGYVFSASLSSPGAMALRVHFTGFDLPAKAGLFLFTEDGQVFGPYTRGGPLNNGEFWSHTVLGDTILLQLRHVGSATDADLRGARFNVAGVGHVRPRFQAGLCAYNESCVENAACGTDVAVDAAENAAARMLFASGRYLYLCSGGLLSDTDAATDTPYFLTANHCISKGREANSLETFFQLKSACPATAADCNDISSHPASLRTLGSSIKSTGRATDYTLLELSEPAPGGSAFLGWDATPVAFDGGTNLYRISHPAGALQAYSTHRIDDTAPTCNSWPRGDRIYSRDTFGATEGGSSGSPVVNAAGHVVGQLSGACGTNVGDVCDSVNNATVDGAFAAYFSEVSQFLDPDPSSCNPVPEICDDGIDNDCDGDIDGEDADCAGAPGGQGDACLVNSDCASNKCKGKPGAKTCK